MSELTAEIAFLERLRSYIENGHKPFDINQAFEDTLRAIIVIGKAVAEVRGDK